MFATEGVSCLQMTLLWQLLPLENECSERFFDQAVRTTFSPAYYTRNNWDNSLSDPCLFKFHISVLTHPEIYAKRPQVVWLDFLLSDTNSKFSKNYIFYSFDILLRNRN